MGITARYSTRTAILQAYSIEMQATSGFESAGGRASTTTTHKIASKYEAAKIIAAVENQPQLKHWLIWAYGPAVMASIRSVQEGAVNQVAVGISISPGNARRPGAKTRAQLLVYLHMDNYRALAITGSRKYRKPAHFDQAMRRLTSGIVGLDIQNRNYNREFGYLGEQIEGRCSDLDRQGLGKVSQALANIRYERGDPAEYYTAAPYASAS